MAINRDQLKQKVVDGGNARQELFTYLSTHGCLPSGNQVQKRVYFNNQINLDTPEAEAWIDTFLPQYNIKHKGIQNMIFPKMPIGDRAKAAIGVGVVTAGAGLATLVTSAFIDNEAGKELLHLGANTAFLLSPVTTILAYASNFVNDTGKKRMKDMGVVAGASILALLGSHVVNNETQKSLLELGGYAGLGASAIGTLIDLVKYHA